MTVTAQGGCVARDVEQPCEADGLSVVFGAVSDTGELPEQDPIYMKLIADICRYWWTYAWWRRGLVDRLLRPCLRQSDICSRGSS